MARVVSGARFPPNRIQSFGVPTTAPWSRFRMRINSLSLKVALFGGIALAVVFAIGMTVLVQQVSGTIEVQTRQLQAETTDTVAAAVQSGLMHAERSAEGVVTA